MNMRYTNKYITTAYIAGSLVCDFDTFVIVSNLENVWVELE